MTHVSGSKEEMTQKWLRTPDVNTAVQRATLRFACHCDNCGDNVAKSGAFYRSTVDIRVSFVRFNSPSNHSSHEGVSTDSPGMLRRFGRDVSVFVPLAECCDAM